jgi:hypothetical protein
MLKSWLTRLAVASGVVAATVVGAAAPAMAADSSIATERGYMLFIDDGDVFKVCDTMVDGHGVVGKLVRVNIFTWSHTTVLTVTDGGDSGCDKKGYNIGNEFLYEYQMELWWDGDKITESPLFDE